MSQILDKSFVPRDGGFPGLHMVEATPVCVVVAHLGGMITFMELAHMVDATAACVVVALVLMVDAMPGGARQI